MKLVLGSNVNAVDGFRIYLKDGTDVTDSLEVLSISMEPVSWDQPIPIVTMRVYVDQLEVETSAVRLEAQWLHAPMWYRAMGRWLTKALR